MDPATQRARTIQPMARRRTDGGGAPGSIRAQPAPLVRSFAYRLMEALRPQIRAVSEELIARIAAGPEADITRFPRLVHSAVWGLSTRSPR